MNNEEHYHLTEYGVLLSVCKDYDIDISHITPRVGKMFVKEFMELMCKQGYIEKINDDIT